MPRHLAAAAFLALFLAAPACPADPSPGIREIQAQLPGELRRMAGRGELSPVTHALVAVATPPGFTADSAAPVLVINATSDRPWHSSRDLMKAYAPAATARGWIVVAADPFPPVSLADDHASLRMSLAIAALAILGKQWPVETNAPLAFGGFSGGSKYTGWLAAGFVARGRRVIGVYLSGCNENALLEAARSFDVLDAAFRRTPVFLQSGLDDKVATPEDHRRIARELERAGFGNVRVRPVPGGHEVVPSVLGEALDGFGATERRGPPPSGGT
jgi:hypothetical protein